MRRPYYYGIDLIRFFAAISVLVFHLGYFRHRVRPIWPLAWQGWVGVEIVFVVSGLVIANSAAATGPIGFLRGRALRLYPLYLVHNVVGRAVETALFLSMTNGPRLR
jgi:peptidoglycan/LPS O-acetylase OafA/YrhL